MLWLVTGGAGFIGSHITEALVRSGRRVRVLDNLSTGRVERLAPVLARVELRRGDVRELRDCRRAVAGATYVLHHAALSSVPGSVDHPIASHDANATGTLNMLVSAREAGVRRFVLASSSAVYGPSRRFPQKETDGLAPLSPYGCQKLAAEQYATMFARTYGLATIILRYFNVFGPRQDPASPYSAVIPRLMAQARRGQPLEVHWDGRQKRDFTHVANVVSANLLAATTTKGVGQAFNIGDGRAHSINDVIRVLEGIVGRKLERRHAPKRAGDVRRTLADVSRARRILGHRPVMSFEDGLRDTWRFFAGSGTGRPESSSGSRGQA